MLFFLKMKDKIVKENIENKDQYNINIILYPEDRLNKILNMLKKKKKNNLKKIKKKKKDF